ncbi:MAG: hypothetical protein GEU75_11165 [Dehalococcoidia bacterium]|nr:hypothetical protein [Dehalococcoidia bacterium]
MSLTSRLDKVLPALSVRQRIALILTAQAAGEEPGPQLKAIDKLEERREYDRFAALLIAANIHLGAVLYGLEIAVGPLENRLIDLETLAWASTEIAEQEGQAPAKPTKRWRQLRTMTAGTFLGNVAAEVRGELLGQTELCWQALRAVEITWSEITAQFDGADPRTPDRQERAAEVRCRYTALLDKLSPRRPPPEPTEALLDEMRGHVEDAFGLLNIRVTWL